MGVLVQNARLLANGNQSVMAVVKADAYGHGAVPIARAAQNAAHIGHFGVACLSEVQELRKAKIHGAVYTLSPFLAEEASGLVQSDAIPFVSSWEQIAALARAGSDAPFPARCILTVDTGMGREGFLQGEAMAAWDTAQTLFGVKIIGLATHFSCADEPEGCQNHEETNRQTAHFADFVRALREKTDFARLSDGRGNRGLWLSLCNSPGMLRAELPPDLRGESNDTGICGVLCRPGLTLYGIAPFRGALETLPGLRPVLAWKARITLLRNLPEGASIGYGKTHVLPHPSRIATVAAGYADGVSRRLGNAGFVLMNDGGVTPLVGRVSMDQCQINVTDFPDAAVGDTVTLIGRTKTHTQTVLDLAEQINTTPHEITCRLSRRVPRLNR